MLSGHATFMLAAREHKKAEDAENTRHASCGTMRRGGACEYPNRLSFFSLTIITS